MDNDTQKQSTKTNTPKFIVVALLSAIAALFGQLMFSNNGRNSDKDAYQKERKADCDSIKRENAVTKRDHDLMLIKWSENSRKISDSYEMLIRMQREEYYRDKDSLIRQIWRLERNQMLMINNQKEMKKALNINR